MNTFHEGVLKKEAIDALDIKKGEKYIDATIGGGGHTEEILERGGEVLAIDEDGDAIEYIKGKNLGKVTLKKSNFSHIYMLAEQFGFLGASGIIADLGVSTHQLETGERGFSFAKEGPIDMRMNRESQISASDLVNNLDKRRLYEIFQTYGQEKFSRDIVSAICSARQIKPITSTLELAKIVREVYRKKGLNTKINPATKVFQALRIVTNSEIKNLEEFLPQTIKILNSGGRLVIISFHSLEDAAVKRFFKGNRELRVITKKPIGPTDEEITRNPRARSAKMRIAEKI